MAADRSIGRNVHLYDAKDRVTLLGGLILTNGVTKANFYSMVENFLLFQSSFSIEHETSATLEKNEEPLPRGDYYVVGSFTVSKEPFLTRTISLSTGSRLQSFRDEIRRRDGRCVITGNIVLGAYRNHWKGFEAAHIFPLAYEGHWVQHNFARWIIIPAANGETINSKQNGLLLRADIHGLFDNYDISINPDDNHKIVCFADDGNDIAGKFLDEQFRNDPDRPCDELLRWHFRQAVFANMRSAGEPIFEIDFPPGSDVLGEMCGGPKAAERMEFELFSRFAVSSVITWRYGSEVSNTN
ncbi:hypothetical protein OEA41_004924 [Lepraria neglecta]|uniref:HNH nuclease domain-containing protein n=1 Tax=Lepraria neglecta TaxID=209136 RepID=A0AAE0DG77_9LECA|nr:hypothetical protein OEA41_004924 [Lepraria neglecta]